MELTTEQKFKLDNYDKLEEQLRIAKNLLGEFYDVFHSAELNCWDFHNRHSDIERIYEELDECEGLTKPNNTEINKGLNRFFYIWKMRQLMWNTIAPFFNNKLPTLPEFTEDLLLKIGTTDELTWTQWKPDGWKHAVSVEDLCANIVMLCGEIPFGKKDIPGADLAVYQSALSDLVYIALDTAHVDHKPEAIRKWLCDYMDRRKAEKDAKRKKVATPSPGVK